MSYTPYTLPDNLSVNSVTASTGFTGSFIGDGSQLINIPSSAVDLSGYVTNVAATASLAFLTASNTFSQKQIINNSLEQGINVEAIGEHSHAEGELSTAFGNTSHAEGYNTEAGGNYSHAEGYETSAQLTASHAEGCYAQAIADYSHAEGYGTVAAATGSHAEGLETYANSDYQHVQGKFNQTSSNALALIGNGTAHNVRSNIFEVYNNYINVSGALNVTNNFSASQATSSFYGDGSGLYNVNASDVIIRAINKTGADILKGTVVHITASTNNSDTPHITKADWSSDNLSANTIGLAYTDILDNNTGSVITEGLITGIDITSLSSTQSGQVLYLSSSGLFTNIKPSAPKHTVTIGQITRASPTSNSTIYVSIQNGYELSELHDVSTNGKVNGDLIVWDSTDLLWKNSKQLSGSYNLSGSLNIQNSLSASQITGSFSGSYVGDGSGLTNISSGITLTTNNTSGSATLVGNTLNIPKYIDVVPPLSATEIFRGITTRNNSATNDSYGGFTLSTTGTQRAIAIANTNFQTKQIRAEFYNTTAATGRYTGIRDGALWYISGGFRFVCGFGIADSVYSSECRQFYGLSTSSADLTYNDTVTVASLLNIVGIGSDAADTNLQIFHNNGSSTATKIDLGSNFPANRTLSAASTTIYYVELYNPRNSTDVHYKVTNGELNITTYGTISTNTPLTSSALNCFASRTQKSGGGHVDTGVFCITRFGVYNS